MDVRVRCCVLVKVEDVQNECVWPWSKQIEGIYVYTLESVSKPEI